MFLPGRSTCEMTCLTPHHHTIVAIDDLAQGLTGGQKRCSRSLLRFAVSNLVLEFRSHQLLSLLSSLL
jgi:hypothetical protein